MKTEIEIICDTKTELLNHLMTIIHEILPLEIGENNTCFSDSNCYGRHYVNCQNSDTEKVKIILQEELEEMRENIVPIKEFLQKSLESLEYFNEKHNLKNISNSTSHIECKKCMDTGFYGDEFAKYICFH